MLSSAAMALLCGRRMLLLSSSRIYLLPPSRVYTSCTPQAWAVKYEMDSRRLLRIRAQSTSTPATSPALKSAPTTASSDSPFSSLSPLERLRARQLRDVPKTAPGKSASPAANQKSSAKLPALAVSFEELGLSEELMSAVRELGISKPTEVQSLGIPSVLAGENVVMASHTGSGKTLAYMLPIVQVGTMLQFAYCFLLSESVVSEQNF